jgi:DNA modification methylase
MNRKDAGKALLDIGPLPTTLLAVPGLGEPYPSVGDGERWELIRGDCLDVLKTFADESIDSCVCDAPYGLSQEPDATEVLKHWLAGDKYTHKSNGFMGNSWDSFVPGPEYWREVYRVLKPGSHLLTFAGSRTFDLMAIALRLAGFENRDTISVEGVLRWVYSTGMPHGGEIGKMIDKAAGATRKVIGMRPDAAKLNKSVQTAPGGWVTSKRDPELTEPFTADAKKWDGWRSALKSAWEPILVFRKPFSGALYENVVSNGTGAFNIAACKIDNGRYPANVVYRHLPACQLIGVKKVRGDARTGGEGTRPGGFMNVGADKGSPKPCGKLYGDADGTETVEDWQCVNGCPVKHLNEQSGKSHASRFFYVNKPSPKERAAGCEELPEGNDQPTVKPISLMRYLCRLVTPPGGLVLDPFTGSGTTLIAAVLEGFKAVGIEQDANYVEIARRRIEWWQQHPEGTK